MMLRCRTVLFRTSSPIPSSYLCVPVIAMRGFHATKTDSSALTAIAPYRPGSKSNLKGLFGDERILCAEHFTDLSWSVRRNALKLLAKLKLDPKERRNILTLQLYDDLMNELTCAANIARCTASLHILPQYRTLSAYCALEFKTFGENEVHRTSILYESLKNALNNEVDQMDKLDLGVLRLILEHSELNGRHLKGAERSELAKVMEDIHGVELSFLQNSALSVAVPRINQILLGTGSQLTDEDAKNFSETAARSKRRWTYARFFDHNPSREKNLRDLIILRQDKADLCGYKNHAEASLRFSAFDSYGAAKAFLEELIKELRPFVEKECAILLSCMQKTEGSMEKIGEWDLKYLMTNYRRQSAGSVGKLIDTFVTMNDVVNGFAGLSGALFGVKLDVALPEHGEIWLSKAFKITVKRDGQVLGTIYCDLRRQTGSIILTKGKQIDVRLSKQLTKNETQTPIVVLTFNMTDCGTDDREDGEIFLSLREAESLFRELGSAMRTILCRTRYFNSSYYTPKDIENTSSKLMEYFFYDQRTLPTIARFAGRSANGDQPLSVDDAQRMIVARRSFDAIEIVREAVMALFDLEVNGEKAEAVMNNQLVTTELYGQIWKQALPMIERDPRSAPQLRCDQLILQDGRSYSLLYGHTAASLIWQKRFKADPFSSIEGKRLETFWQQGGQLNTIEFINGMLGEESTTDHLLKAMVTELSNRDDLEPMDLRTKMPFWKKMVPW